MASRTQKGAKKNQRVVPARGANLVSAMAIIAIVVLSILDLNSPNNVPSYIYIGLIGASLGAKFDDISRWLGGGRS